MLELFSDSIENDVDNDKIRAFNSNSGFHYSQSHIKQIEYYYNLAENYENSKYYQLGYLICNPRLLMKRKALVKFAKAIVKDFFHL